jgi:hypothetical protein
MTPGAEPKAPFRLVSQYHLHPVADGRPTTDVVPPTMVPHQPIAIIGMHRSGTSLVTRTLQKLGLHVGWRLQDDAESFFQIRLNDWVLRQLGSRWDMPGRVVEYQRDREFRQAAARYLGIRLKSLQARSFLGPRHFLTWGGIAALDVPWGWKDPRVTLTLPTWREVFPGLKVIHVSRHGMDVALSLKTRADRQFKSALSQLEGTYAIRYLFRARTRGLTHSVRCRDLAQGLELWREYEAISREVTSDLDSERLLSFRYEDFLADPRPLVERMAAFCGLERSARRIDRALDGLKPERSLAYRSNPEAVALAEREAETLRRYGYEP